MNPYVEGSKPVLFMPPMSTFQIKQKLKQQIKKAKKEYKAKRPPIAKSKSQVVQRARLNWLGNSIANRSTNRRQQFIQEDEFVADIPGSADFSCTALPVNPGMLETLPWGSRVASLYAQYEFEELEFYYKREVSEFAANGASGKVMLSFSYDALAVPPANKQEVEDSVPHVDGMPCTSEIRLKIDCARLRKNLGKYVRVGAVPSGGDLKTYDCGQFFISTIGNASVALVGELHVRYKLRLHEPILSQVAASFESSVHIATPAATGTQAEPFTGAVQVYSSGGMEADVTNTHTIQINGAVPGQEYMVSFLSDGATGTLTAQPQITVVSGANSNLIFANDTDATVTSWSDVLKVGQFALGLIATASNFVLNCTAPQGQTAGYTDLIVETLGVLYKSKRKVRAARRAAELQMNGDERLVKLLERVNKLEGKLAKSLERCSDSEFEEEKWTGVAATSAASAASRPDRKEDHPLSASTVDLIGELIARKSSSNKKC